MTEHVFIQSLNSILIDNKFDRVVARQRTGKLNTKGLYKAKLNGRVFKKRLERLNKHYDATIIIDCSGSMNEAVIDPRLTPDGKGIRRYQVASDSCEVLHRCLTKAKIPCRVLAFQSATKEMIGFTEKIQNYKNFHGKIQHYVGGDNCDACAVFRAVEEARQRPGKHIVIVLSDGGINYEEYLGEDVDPVVTKLAKRTGMLDKEGQDKDGFNHASGRTNLTKQVQRAIKLGILFVGIGIQDDAVKQYYPKQFCDIITAESGEGKTMTGRAIFDAVAKQLRKHVQRG